MTSTRVYQLGFLALGGLIALALAFHISRRAANEPLGADRSSRREELAPLRGVLNSVAALRNPQRMLFGAYDGGFPGDMTGFVQLESRLRFRFPIISLYAQWGDKPDQQFPFRAVETIERFGSVPMITWEPWVTHFEDRLRTNLPPREQRQYASLTAIARGDYDFYIVPWAQAAAEFRKPMFLRFAHEMNDPYRYPWGPQNGNRPDDFIAAWRRVYNIFERVGATNVIWMWSPQISISDFGSYYPGDEYVDWVGVAVLNYGSAENWSRWWTFDQILEKSYGPLAALKKPIMICEFGTVSEGGDMLEWYRQAFYDMENTYGLIRGVVFFNQRRPIDWSVVENPRVAEFVAGEMTRLSQM